MSTSTILTRRDAIIGLGGATLALSAVPGFAAAPLLGPLAPVANRFRLGGAEVTTIFDGEADFGPPHPTIGGNAPEADVVALAAKNFLPTDKLVVPFTPTLVNTGEQLILFDTGNGAGAQPGRGNLVPHLAAAGYTPEDVDLVVITHMHPDHIGGLMTDGAPTFPNAVYAMGAKEWDFWTSEARLSGPTERAAKIVQSNVVPLEGETNMIAPGDAVAPGIEAVASFGHTPGHLAFHIENEGQRLMLTGDVANHFVLALERPGWHFGFDADPEEAVKARREVFGMIAADKIPFVGYHMPFPAVGFVEQKGEGFVYSPESYQLSPA